MKAMLIGEIIVEGSAAGTTIDTAQIMVTQREPIYCRRDIRNGL